MQCLACAAALDASAVFPGASIRCACGADNVVPLPARLVEATPYRDAAPPQSSSVAQAAMISCPFCGGPCVSEARACPHCNVELAAVRCPECFALHFTGARFCSRCRAELHDAPLLLLDASDSPCPRCDKPLRTTPESGVFECAACGGLFVDHTAFAALAHEKEIGAPIFGGAAIPHALPSALEAEVHYVKCPACREVMNRVNFGKRSGVIVDVCGLHGTWFDPGELTRVLEWIGSGAYGAERERERAEETRARQAAERAHAHPAGAPIAFQSAAQPHVGIGLPSVEEIIDLLRSIF